MPKAPRKKYYAVRVGRQGPKIYDTWEECSANVSRWPSAIFKSFLTREDAERWVSTPHRIERDLSILKHHLQPEETGVRGCIPGSSCERGTPVPSIENAPEVSVPTVVLSTEQGTVLEMIKRGENVFFTGSAGTGKSVLLRAIIDACGGRGCPTLAITASTGIAAVNIGGTTLHSWAGIGMGKEDAKKIAGKFLGQEKLKAVLDRWRRVQTLILDEISMIDGVLFDKLEFIARVLRNSDKPFGGIQLALSGDFCQLPPVPDRDKNGNQVSPIFAFEAECWNGCIKRPIVLTRVFRQKEQGFANMLNDMRLGRLDDHTIRAFQKLSRPLNYEDGIGPMQLYPTRAEVDRANELRLHALPGKATQYNATDVPGYDSSSIRVSEQQMERLLGRLVAPRAIQLKVGAQVMLIKNMVQGELVNGSVGQVIRFCTSKEAMRSKTEIATEEGLRGSEHDVGQVAARFDGSQWPVVRFMNGRELLCVPTDFTVDNAFGEMEARRRQIPLILAWALSVHKSQGQTLERVKVDLGHTFEKGQAYVALSRATSMRSLEVLNFDPCKVMVHPRILAWYNDLEQQGASMQGLEEAGEEWSGLDAGDVQEVSGVIKGETKCHLNRTLTYL